MCKVLNISFDILAKINHKGLLVEKIHRLIVKSITITAEDRETNFVFFTVGVATDYEWNSSPIDGTYTS